MRSKIPRLVWRTVVDTFDDHVPGLAAEMAFYVVLAMPPLLLAVLGTVGFVLGGLPEGELVELETRILDAARTVLTPETVNGILAEPVARLLREGRGDVASLGVVLTLWSASRAANVLLRTVTIAYDREDPRPAWKRRLLALVITVVGVGVAASVIPLMVLGPRVAAGLLDGVAADLAGAWPFIYWSAVAVVAVVALAWLYHVSAGWDTPWRRDLPGAVLALLIWVGAAWATRNYTAQLLGVAADDAFQGLAAPLVLLLWVYASSLAVLVGAELNAEIEKMWPSRVAGEDPIGEFGPGPEGP